MSEAARLLGYGRSRIYGLKAELNATRDPRTGTLRVPASAVEAYRQSPPPRRRPLPPEARPGFDRQPPAETPACPAGARQAPSVAPVLRSAKRAVARFKALQEALIAAEDEARALEAKAAARRTDARRALRKLSRAHAAAVQAVAEATASAP